jgi:hypothetical protein
MYGASFVCGMHGKLRALPFTLHGFTGLATQKMVVMTARMEYRSQKPRNRF